MSKVYLFISDDGHGVGTPGKRSPYIKEIGRQIQENEFNSAVVKLMGSIVSKLNTKVHFYSVAPTDEDTPLVDRVNRANSIYQEFVSRYGKDNVMAVYVSIHYDAYDSEFNGYDPEGITVFINKGTSSGDSGKLAKSINKYLIQGTSQKNRGIKEERFYVLNKTLMPAVLTENGFMDNKREALLMIDKDFQKEVAEEHVKGVCEYFGIPYSFKEENKTEDKKEEKDVEFTSPTLKEKFESRVNSKNTASLIDAAAVALLGHTSKLKDGKLTNGDLAAISVELAVHLIKNK